MCVCVYVHVYGIEMNACMYRTEWTKNGETTCEICRVTSACAKVCTYVKVRMHKIANTFIVTPKNFHLHIRTIGSSDRHTTALYGKEHIQTIILL